MGARLNGISRWGMDSMEESVTAYIGLGSNLGDRPRIIKQALVALGRHREIQVVRVSDIKPTSALGQAHQPEYLNGVAEIHTSLSPGKLLEILLATESMLGRERTGQWQSRTIDLDLLLYGREIIQRPNLIVPHPQMHLRSFVLDGLCQLNDRLVHPLLNEPVSKLFRCLNGHDFVLNPKAPQLVSVAGLIGVGKTTLVNRLAHTLDAVTFMEPYETNPFLPHVYAGKKELALDSQLYFLVHRAEQLDPKTLAQGSVFLTDYVFEKELIYARHLLDTDQLELYERLYRQSLERIASPVLVIHLQDSPANCLGRIHRRNRPYEQEITLDFLQSLDIAYEELFAGWSACPVLRLPASDIGLDDAGAIEHVALQVNAYVAAGTYSFAS